MGPGNAVAKLLLTAGILALLVGTVCALVGFWLAAEGGHAPKDAPP